MGEIFQWPESSLESHELSVITALHQKNVPYLDGVKGLEEREIMLDKSGPGEEPEPLLSSLPHQMEPHQMKSMLWQREGGGAKHSVRRDS